MDSGQHVQLGQQWDCIRQLLDAMPKQLLAQAASQVGAGAQVYHTVLGSHKPSQLAVWAAVAQEKLVNSVGGCFSPQMPRFTGAGPWPACSVQCGAHARSLQYFETHVRTVHGGGLNPAAYRSATYSDDEVSYLQASATAGNRHGRSACWAPTHAPLMPVLPDALHARRCR